MTRTVTRLISLLLVAVMLLAAFPLTASAETESGRLGNSNVYYELNDDGTLRLYGSGATPNYSGTNQSPFVEIGYINKIIVDEGVTKLGDYIFERCDVTEVSLPTSLRELGMFVFGGCEYLEEIELQSATKTFGIGVFYHCSSLKKITFHANTINCFQLYENENGFSFNSLLSPVENASVYIPLPITVNESLSGVSTNVTGYEKAAELFNKNGNTVYCVNSNATIKWKNYDGTVLETDTDAAQGEIPTYDGATPEKPVDDNYGYVFSGWTPEPFAVMGDMSYTAVFETVDRTAYIDENGVTQYAGARTLTGTETELPGGWYLVDRDITYTNNLKFTGDVHIILADGATMNTLGTTNYSVLSDAGLFIYCQEGRTGALISDGIVANYVKICGGNVNIANTIITAYDVDIYGDRVDVGSIIWSMGGNMNIYGGNISVSTYISVKNAITIGYKNPTDSIYSKEYRISNTGTGIQAITFADGKSFKNANDATEIFTGTADLDTVKEKTLVPYSYNTITYASDEYGTVTGVSGANFGEEVTLTVSPNTGYYLDSLTVKDASNNDITLIDGNKFVMPASNVTVTAVFTALVVNTTYIDANGEAQQVIATKLTSDRTTLTEGWYIVNENVTFNSNLKLSGTVNLILGDGATMSTSGNFDYVDNNTMFELNVYGQQMQTGTLNSTATNIFYSFNTYGGNVYIYSILGLNVNILGGNFTAQSLNAVNNGVITLGCNTPSSTITVQHYTGTVKIADGQTLVDQNFVTYSGTLANSSAIDGKTLRAYKMYDINEDGYEDIDDIAFIISASVGAITMTASQEAKADLNNDGVVDAFDAAKLDRILFSVNTAKGDVNQDGEINEADYAMVKSYVECKSDLLSTDYLDSRYDTLKTQYPQGTIITQQYYCADYDCDKAVDAFDLFYLDKRINVLV